MVFSNMENARSTYTFTKWSSQTDVTFIQRQKCPSLHQPKISLRQSHPLAGRSPLTEEAWPNCRESHFWTHFQTHVRMTGRSPLKRRPYSRVASSGRSRPSVLDLAHPRPERPDPGWLAGIWPFPDQKRGRGCGRARIVWGAGFSGGSGWWVSGGRGRSGGGRRAEFSAVWLFPARWVQQWWKDIFVYVLKFILTYFNNKLMWSSHEAPCQFVSFTL
jgi:hypothetical protein